MHQSPEELFNTLAFAEDLMLHSLENSFNSGGAWLLWFDYFLSQWCDVVIHETAKRLRLSYSDRSGTTQIPFQNGEQADIFTIKDAAVSVRQKIWMLARCEYSHCGATILYASSSCSEWVMHHLWMDLLPLRNIHDSKQDSAGHALVSPSS